MNIIEYSYVDLHNTTINDTYFKFLKTDENFGILKLKTRKTKLTENPTFILFTIDITSSMNENAYSNITKMDVVKNTFKNMINYLAKIDAPIYIQVNAFNDSVNTIIQKTLVKKENQNDLVNEINKLCGCYCTDIGIAIKNANESIISYKNEYPDHQIVHLFMTDGQPTVGELNYDVLASMVETSITNIFIGFGDDHNIKLLKKLSETYNSDYLFVDHLENTSLIYGETIHRFLYPALQRVEIVVDNGLIYNWKTNQWVTRLDEPFIVGDMEKIYHIKTTNRNPLYCELYGKIMAKPLDDVFDVICDYDNDYGEFQHLQSVDILPNLLDIETSTINICDLSKYMYRQTTQEFLYKARFIDNKTQRNALKDDLRVFFKNMRSYMKKNDLLDDKFMITLCDDICIIYRSSGKKTDEMLRIARETSQGKQQSYNSTPKSAIKRNDSSDSNIDCSESQSDGLNDLNQSFMQDDTINTPLPKPILKRTATYSMKPSSLQINIDNEDDIHNYDIGNMVRKQNINKELVDSKDIDEYEISMNTTTCYANESTLNTMLNMSQSM